jgi:hypothetical protein
MLKGISWTDYWIFILVTLAAYYITIGCLYYLTEIKHALSGKSNLLLPLHSSKKVVAIKNQVINTELEDDLHPLVKECMDQIKNVLKEAVENNLVKQEIIYSLQQLTNKYSVIKNSLFKSFINDYILIECDNYCSIHLDKEEVRKIWLM